MKEHYTIDLKTNVLDIRSYEPQMIETDLKLLGLRNAMDMDLSDDFNTKIFRTEKDAEKWRSKYVSTKERLLKKTKCIPGMPKMLCKQRYLILSALGEKSYTRRNYLKKMNVGDAFQLYDQNIFLTVRLTDITEDDDGKYTYEYELI